MQLTTREASIDLVLLPGWGMNGSVWTDLAPLLADGFRVHCIDLPSSANTLDEVIAEIAQLKIAGAVVCGWSLGGEVALQWALQKAKEITGVILIATTPRFVNGADWDCGMDAAVFDAFARDVERDAEGTLQRFLLLQAQGDVAARDVARRLRECVSAKPHPHAASLGRGLKVLKETDLRSALPKIAQPVLILHGDSDQLVPIAAAQYLARSLPHVKLETIAGAAHAPFISNPAAVAKHITAFLHG